MMPKYRPLAANTGEPQQISRQHGKHRHKSANTRTRCDLIPTSTSVMMRHDQRQRAAATAQHTRQATTRPGVLSRVLDWFRG